jgi:putative phosphoesterase
MTARRVGLISDTHGLVRPEALNFLRGSDYLVHAGDICAPEVLAELSRLAPLTVVRGNNDEGPWAECLPEQTTLEVDGIRIGVVHDLAQWRVEPAAVAVRVVVSGHSHKPSVREQDGVLYVNPGSAGPRRFKLPISVAELLIDAGSVAARLCTLVVSH